jgi:hypothetical protein
MTVAGLSPSMSMWFAARREGRMVDAASGSVSARTLSLLKQTTANDVCYIKLGRKSSWWPLCRATDTIRIHFRLFDYELCSAGNWEAARQEYVKRGAKRRDSDVTRAVNQVKEFFALPELTLWMTIEDGDVWWCFAEREVKNIYLDDDQEKREGARLRFVVDRWRNSDV